MNKQRRLDYVFSMAKPVITYLSMGINCIITFHIFLNVFIYFLRESASGGGTEREGDRGSEAGSALTAASPMWGSNSGTRDHDLSGSPILNGPSHPSAPQNDCTFKAGMSVNYFFPTFYRDSNDTLIYMQTVTGYGNL